MDIRALAAVLSFCVQIAAGAAPMKWPQYTWLADLIFWGACLIGVGCLVWWFLSNYRPRLPWTNREQKQPPATASSSAAIDKFYPPTVTTSPPSLAKSLYIGEIRLSFNKLEKDRHSELTMKVFNGSGRVVEFGQVSGRIKFKAPNNDPLSVGELPTPSPRHDTKRTAGQLEEWFLILSQPVPGSDADKLLKMLASDISIHFDLSELNIEVFPHENKDKVERLPIWGAVSYSREYGFGRIIQGTAKIRAGSASVST